MVYLYITEFWQCLSVEWSWTWKCTGQALMAMKALFSNMADVLLDWDDAHNDDFCSWRGVFCDNVSLTVVSLWVYFIIPWRIFALLYLNIFHWVLFCVLINCCCWVKVLCFVCAGTSPAWTLVERYHQPLVIWETCNPCMFVWFHRV